MFQLDVESWLFYSVVLVIVICRFVSRTLLFGSIKKLQLDDWVILFAMCTYTTLIASINVVADSNSNLLPPDFDVRTLTPHDVAAREYGSKMVLVVEQMQCVTVWAVKASLLIMYYRLTVSLKQNWLVKCLAVYTTLSFVVMEILYLGVWCRPFHNYWKVPTPNVQCSAATNHLILNAVFNISSDLIMLAIGISLYIGSALPLKRKLILSGIFGLGVFVILSAVLNKYYSFTQPFGSLWTFWYVRESSTALLVANLPFLWTLLRRVFHLHAFDGGGSSGSRSRRTSSRTTLTTLTRWSCGTSFTLRKVSIEKRSVRCEGLTVPDKTVVSVRVDVEALRVDAWDCGYALECPMERAYLPPARRTTSLEEGKIFTSRQGGCSMV